MKIVTLHCWEHFRCIAQRCRHSCCVGWEIDVDEESLRRYAAVSGAFGQRLRHSIAVGEDGAFFALCGEDERCPFLNEKGLCDIILTLGEDALCDICAEHPRYRFRLGNREELGYGLCCEEAARELLCFPGKLEIVTLWDDGGEEDMTAWERELTERRRSLFALAQDRGKSIMARCEGILRAVDAPLPRGGARAWSDKLRDLERLDEAWDREIELLGAMTGSECASIEPEIPGEQLLVSFLYRHLAPAEDAADLRRRAVFAVWSLRVIAALCAAHDGTVETLCELARLYSSEIEYSDENLPALLTFCGDGG